MSSLIANKVKSIMGLVSLKLFIVLTILYELCRYSNLYHVYNTNCNNNCLVYYFYHTTIRQTFTMAIFKPRLFFTRNFTQG